MPQSLIQLPKDAEFEIEEWCIKIEDHQMMYGAGLFTVMMDIVKGGYSHRNTLYQFEKHGISFEAAIECCVRELEYDTDAFIDFIRQYCDGMKYMGSVADSLRGCGAFSESEIGRKIATQFVEKIRSCDDWDEFCTEMSQKSKFITYIKKKIKEEMRQQCRKI